MPGALDQSVPAGINPGLLSAQNLVNANAPAVMSPSAIQAMSDSMRTGALTAQDIIDRVGELGKTARKAQIEMHKREIADLQDPELVAAKHAITLAGGAQANLAGAQAQAQQTLVPAQTQIQAGQLAQGVAELGSGIPSQTLRQLNLTYGLGAKFDPQTGVLQNPDEVLPNLTHIMGSLNSMQIGKELGDRIDTKPVTDAQGNTTQVPVWKGTGQPLTNAQKSFVNRFNGVIPGQGIIPPQGAPSAATPQSMVQPNNTPHADNSAATLSSPIGVPAGPPVDANGNLVTATRTEAEKAKLGMELTEETRKQEPYKDWRKAKNFYNNAVDAISAINKVPLAAQRAGSVNLNARDTELAEAVVKMLDPQGAVREFKWNKFESNQPWPEQVRNIMSRIKQEGKFTPETRQELFKVANDSIRSHENQAADFLKQSAAKGAPLTDQETALASGQTTPAYASPTENAATPAGAAAATQTRTLAGRQMISADGGKTWNWVR